MLPFCQKEGLQLRYPIPLLFLQNWDDHILGVCKTGLGSEEQEKEIVNVVIANNSIRLLEIQLWVIEDQQVFRGIDAISIPTIDSILRKKLSVNETGILCTFLKKN